MIKTFFFDLDGTLLPMDQDLFVKGYFGMLAKKLAAYGHQPEALIKAVYAGVAAMVANDGSQTNEQVFWDTYAGIFGKDRLCDVTVFEDFYANDFGAAKACCGYDPAAAQTVAAVKALGCQTVLATNPIFPAVATKQRIQWAGLAEEDFLLCTTFENSRFSKPNPAYYQDLLDRLNLQPEECLMVGNDAKEDMAAAQVGMEVFLLTDCLINKQGIDITQYPQGGFEALLDYVKERV